MVPVTSGSNATASQINAIINWILGAVSDSTATAVPVGCVLEYTGIVAPAGWLICQGQAVSRTTYASLFSVISTSYGSGDGSTTFNLPDLRGRVVVGAGAGAGLTNRPLASGGGEENHTLSWYEMATHYHGISDPSHAHGLGNALIHLHASSVGLGSPAAGQNAQGDSSLSSAAAGTGISGTQNAGANFAHNNMQPYTALNRIIKF